MACSREIPNPVEATTQEIGGHKNAKFAAKVIEILTGANYQEHIDLVLDGGITDYWLPVPLEATMPPNLLDYISFEAFSKSQSSVLENSYELNRSHIPLDTQAMYERNGGSYPKSLIYKRYLGEGGAGIVVEVQEAGGTTYALKRFSRETKYLEAKDQLRSIKKEIEILKKINHTHCIKFMGSYGDVTDIGVIMDPVADCNLESFLSTFDHSEPNNRMLANFFGCLASALKYLHWEVGIRHKDIKPQNILVKRDRVMLTDFGIALDCGDQGKSTTQEEAKRSPRYCAPEAVREEHRNRKSDIWSLGCVFLEMSAVLRGFSSGYVTTILKHHGCLFFRECPEGIHDAISDVRERSVSDNYDPLELEWIEQMLQLENEKRLTSKELQLAISQSSSNPPFCGICCNRSKPTSHGRIPADGTHQGAEAQPVAPKTELVKLYDRKMIKWYKNSVEVIRDNSVSGAWVSKRVVDLYELEVRQMRQQETLTMGGQQFMADTKVDVTFATDTANHSEKADCWVIPASFDLLIGTSTTGAKKMETP